MKFTSEDLMKAMGLQVGDKVKNLFNGHTFIITNDFKLVSIEDEQIKYDIPWLLDKNIKIIPRPKKVGDLKCVCDCTDCPLKCVCSWDCDFEGNTLYDILRLELTTVHNDQEIHDLLKARLDKEVVKDND